MRIQKTIVSLLLCSLLLVLVSVPVAAIGDDPFDDVKSDTWYYSYVGRMHETGLMLGTSPTTFSPDVPLTREMTVTVLYRLADYLKLDTSFDKLAPYPDVSQDAYYTEAIAWGNEHGVVQGFPDGTFGIGQMVTREQFCVFVVRFLEKNGGYDLSAYRQDPTFEDSDKINNYAKESVGIAEALSLVNGRTLDLFVPRGTTTRAEAATLFSRILAAVEQLKHTYQTEIILGNGAAKDSIRVTDNGETVYQWTGTLDIPVLRLEGDTNGISKEHEVAVSASYNGGGTTFDCYASMKFQGHSSLAYEKKNYTIKLYQDQSLSSKNKIDLGWGKESKYCLKANYIDYSQSRNVVSAKLWGQIVKSRKDCNPNLMALTNGGAIDGYPIIVFINGEYQGLYTLNTPKDEWIWDSSIDKLYTAVTMEIAGDSTAFRRTSTLKQGEWEVEYAKNDDEQAAMDSINRLITFVANNNGSAFVNGIDQYLDVDAAIDYMLYSYYMCAPDNVRRNGIFISYDGIHWIPSMYDMDATWGLHWNGRAYYKTDYMLPNIRINGTLDSGGQSLLWDRLLQNFPDRVYARYSELRKTILNETAVVEEFIKFQSKIPMALFETEPYVYPAMPGVTTNNIEQIRSYIKAREALLDPIMEQLVK